MKNYEKLQQLKPELFKRLTGVKLATFEAMLQECELYHEKKKSKGGKPNKLSVSTQILLMLEYYREYRSMAHMAFDYEVSESTVSKTIRLLAKLKKRYKKCFKVYMSKYKQLQKKPRKNFKRLIGVNENTFNEMIAIFRTYEKERTKNHGVGGRKSLSPEDKVLLMLSYYREYRTLEHIGFDYSVSESTASRVVRERV